VVDFTGDGRLSRKEAIDALKAQLPTDNVLLDAALADPNHWMWQQWDVDGSGFIEKEEILAPNVRHAVRRGLWPSLSRALS